MARRPLGYQSPRCRAHERAACRRVSLQALRKIHRRTDNGEVQTFPPPVTQRAIATGDPGPH